MNGAYPSGLYLGKHVHWKVRKFLDFLIIAFLNEDMLFKYWYPRYGIHRQARELHYLEDDGNYDPPDFVLNTNPHTIRLKEVQGEGEAVIFSQGNLR